MLRRIVLVVVLAAMASPLGACGRRGALEAPEGTTYPKTYPADIKAPPADDTDKKKP